MAKRRESTGGEVSLFPFLSILACLIGALILIIVVLSVVQTQKSDGRTPEEMKLAKEFQELQKQEKEQSKVNEDLAAKLTVLEKVKQEAQEKTERLARMRKLLASSGDVRKLTEELSQNMLKDLDNLMLEIDGLTKQEADSKKEIAALTEEIRKRQPPEKKDLPPVIVHPGGSGLAEGSKLFFIEASGGKLVIFWNEKNKSVIAASPDVIASDVSLNDFLKRVAAVPKSKIIFLLRDDGLGAYLNGAGWAQATYGYRVDQIGKLPIPGRGEINLATFKNYLGELEPPPDTKPPPPAAPPPPGAPPKKT